MMRVRYAGLGEISQALQGMCETGFSGVLYISTDRGEGAGIAIEDGSIIDVGFKALRGNEAIQQICTITRCKYLFKPGPAVLPGRRQPTKAPLASTRKILSCLNARAMAQLEKSGPYVVKLQGKRILIIDDSRMVRKAAQQALSAIGCEVIAAIDGEHGLSLLESSRPDLILLDLILPGMDGYAVLKKIRQRAAGEDIPVILMSSLDAMQHYAEGEETLGAERLDKPFNTEGLLEIVYRQIFGVNRCGL